VQKLLGGNHLVFIGTGAVEAQGAEGVGGRIVFQAHNEEVERDVRLEEAGYPQ
jgi:hypothetical protein